MKTFIKEYEEWVDKYIELTNKYKENPSDIAILSEYTEMISELTEWTQKSDDVQKSLEKASPSEVVEYTKEVARIVTKISNITE